MSDVDGLVCAAPAKATRREWTGLAVIALPCAVYAMDLTVLNLALPAISAELAPSAAQLLWISTASSSPAFSSRWARWATASGPAGCCSSARPHSASPRCWPRWPTAPRR